jgi:hypothetical protein
MGALGLINPSLALKGVSAMSQGHLMGLPVGDVKQLAGVFVIDTDGTIRMAHISRQVDDIPEIDDIVSALAGDGS